MIWHRFLGIRTSLLTTLIGGYALLAVCWVFTDPPGAAPDEAAHYVRALGIGRGQLVGLRRVGLDVVYTAVADSASGSITW